MLARTASQVGCPRFRYIAFKTALAVRASTASYDFGPKDPTLARAAHDCQSTFVTYEACLLGGEPLDFASAFIANVVGINQPIKLLSYLAVI